MKTEDPTLAQMPTILLDFNGWYIRRGLNAFLPAHAQPMPH